MTANVHQDIIPIIEEKVRNRGAVYLSYNAMPGCASHQPLKRLYSDLYQNFSGPPLEKIGHVVKSVDDLVKKNVAYFTQSPLSTARHAALKENPTSYFAHEYLNEAWGTYFFTDISEQFEKANLSFAGSAMLGDTLSNAKFEMEHKELLQKIPDLNLREQLKDYFKNSNFRKDIFLRGKLKYDDADWMREVNSTRIGVYGTHNKFPCKFELNGEKIELNQLVHGELITHLKKGPHSFGELRGLATFSQMDFLEFFHMICSCIEAGQISLLRYAEDISIFSPETAMRLNKVLLELASVDGKYQFLAAPEFGCGISCSQIDQIFLHAIHDGKDPAEQAIKAMQEKNEPLLQHGQPVRDPDEALKLLQEAAEEFKKQKLEYLEKFAIAA